jgi:hypothetical protein
LENRYRPTRRINLSVHLGSEIAAATFFGGAKVRPVLRLYQKANSARCGAAATLWANVSVRCRNHFWVDIGPVF